MTTNACQTVFVLNFIPMKVWLSLFLFITFSALQAQEIAENPKESSEEFTQWGYGNEFLGAAHFWSFLVTHRPHENWLIHGGFSYILIPGATYNADYVLFPVSVSYLVGGFGHSLELNAGLLISIPAEMGYRTADRKGLRATSTSQAFTPEFGIGYAYYPKNDGWYFRATAYTVYGRDPKKDIYNFLYWGGLSLGRMF